jgi:hypothetical protein
MTENCQVCHASSAINHYFAPEDVYFDTKEDCWRWKARLDREGYGIVNVYVPGLKRNASMKAHIVSHLCLTLGRLSADDLFLAYKEHSASGLELDHLCREQWCIFPDHLEVVTGSINCERKYDARA